MVACCETMDQCCHMMVTLTSLVFIFAKIAIGKCIQPLFVCYEVFLLPLKVPTWNTIIIQEILCNYGMEHLCMRCTKEGASMVCRKAKCESNMDHN